jgi:hypothetical protein
LTKRTRKTIFKKIFKLLKQANLRIKKAVKKIIRIASVKIAKIKASKKIVNKKVAIRKVTKWVRV